MFRGSGGGVMSEGFSTWPVYVINMADNTARMEKCRNALGAAGIAFERFEAVNGRALGADDVAGVYDAGANASRFRHPLVAGEIGCYLSHVEVWRKLVLSDAPGAVVLEDDFEAEADLPVVLHALAHDAGRGEWDMVKLYTRRPDKRMLARRPLCEGYEIAHPYQVPNTTLGYVITRASAEQLLRRSLPFARPIDEDHKRFWEHHQRIRVVLPPPIHPGVEASRGDTIASARRKDGRGALPARLRQAITNLRYRLKYLAALHWHRRGGLRKGGGE